MGVLSRLRTKSIQTVFQQRGNPVSPYNLAETLEIKGEWY